MTPDAKFIVARRDEYRKPSQIVFKNLKPIELAPVSSFNGAWADQSCFGPAVSHNGEFACFVSTAGNLGIENPEKAFHVYRWDRKSKKLQAMTTGAPKELSATYKNSVSVSNDGKVISFTTPKTKQAPTHLWIVEEGKAPVTLSAWLKLGEAAKGESRGEISADGNQFFAVVSDAVYNNGTDPGGYLYIEGTKESGITRRIVIPKEAEKMGRIEVSADGTTIAFNSITKTSEKRAAIGVWINRRGQSDEFKRVLSHEEPYYTHTPWGLALSGNGNVIVYQNVEMDGKNEIQQVIAENWITHDRRVVSYDPWGKIGKVNAGLDATSLRSFVCNMDGSQIAFAGTFVKPHQTSGPDSLAWSFLYIRDMNAGATKKIP